MFRCRYPFQFLALLIVSTYSVEPCFADPVTTTQTDTSTNAHGETNTSTDETATTDPDTDTTTPPAVTTVITAPATAGNISIACLDANGNVQGGDPALTCKSILPKCNDMVNTVAARVKDLLSWKIYGYRMGLDLDVFQSTPDHLIYKQKMSYPVCNVMGPTVQYKGARPAYFSTNRPAQTQSFESAGIEYSQQLSAPGVAKAPAVSCGLRPSVGGGKSSMALGFNSTNGTPNANGTLTGDGALWTSYMLGAYPWIIRAEAANVLASLAASNGSIGSLVTTPEIAQSVSSVQSGMQSFYKQLGTAAQSVCNSSQDIVADCLAGKIAINNPGVKICTLAQAQLSMNQGAFPNVVVATIIKNVQTKYNLLFQGLVVPGTASYNQFIGAVQHVEGGSSRYKKSCLASRIFDGGDFYTWKSNNTTTEDTDSSSRNCWSPVTYAISTGAPQFNVNGSGAGFFAAVGGVVSGAITGGIIAGPVGAVVGADVTVASDALSSLSGGGGGPNSQSTLNFGFAGRVEYLIRSQVCGQKASYTESSPCDAVQIGDTPAKANPNAVISQSGS